MPPSLYLPPPTLGTSSNSNNFSRGFRKFLFWSILLLGDSIRVQTSVHTLGRWQAQFGQGNRRTGAGYQENRSRRTGGGEMVLDVCMKVTKWGDHSKLNNLCCFLGRHTYNQSAGDFMFSYCFSKCSYFFLYPETCILSAQNLWFLTGWLFSGL